MARLMSGLLYEVRATDPGVLAIAVAVVLSTAWLASRIPAGRGGLVDPMVTMRAE